MGTPIKKVEQPAWLELERIIPLAEVEKITSLSHDSLGRHHKDKIIHLSPRRRGMKLRDVLAINGSDTNPDRTAARLAAGRKASAS
jgi:hypothetical protein